MRTITMHAMPHGKAAIAWHLHNCELNKRTLHARGFPWPVLIGNVPFAVQCRAGAAKAWRLALSGEAHGGGGPRARQGKARGYAGGSITRGRELEGHTSRFWVENPAWKRRKNMSFFLAKPYGPGLKSRLRLKQRHVFHGASKPPSQPRTWTCAKSRAVCLAAVECDIMVWPLMG